MRAGPLWTTYGAMTPEETRARLLYRDGLILVLDKPAGVAVHRGPKGGSSLEDDFDALRFGLPRKPALAHRLDRETAGCLVLGRHHKALEKLGLLFKQGKIAKTYWAIVAGSPEAESGAINLPLGRLDDRRGWWMKVDPKGQPARTLWRVKGRGVWRGAPIAWLELEPKTGRTHQLRVHWPRRAGRSSATPSTARAPTRRCSCWRARSWCRSRRESRRSRSRCPRRRTCSRRSPPAVFRTTGAERDGRRLDRVGGLSPPPRGRPAKFPNKSLPEQQAPFYRSDFVLRAEGREPMRGKRDILRPSQDARRACSDRLTRRRIAERRQKTNFRRSFSCNPLKTVDSRLEMEGNGDVRRFTSVSHPSTTRFWRILETHELRECGARSIRRPCRSSNGFEEC